LKVLSLKFELYSTFNCQLLQLAAEDIKFMIGLSQIFYCLCIISDDIANCLAKADLFLIPLSAWWSHGRGHL